MRRSLAWIVAVPLMVGGTWAAHALDYRLTMPDPGTRATLLAATGHGYEEWLPLAAAVSIAGLLVALVRSADQLRAGYTRPSAWPFLLLPPLSFATQEHVERLLHDGSFPWHAAAEPTFARGVALTLPFGLAAYLAARAILRVARAVARALAPARPILLALRPPAHPRAVTAARVRVASSGRRTRGPPSFRS
jgi:hypothetical protein